jgi:hypothetical protein
MGSTSVPSTMNAMLQEKDNKPQCTWSEQVASVVSNRVYADWLLLVTMTQ